MSRTLAELVPEYAEYLKRAGYRPRVITCYRHQLGYFAHWASTRCVDRVDQLSAELLQDYRRHLDGESDLVSGRAAGTMIRRERLAKLRRWLAWLHREGMSEADLSRSVPTAEHRPLRAG